MQGTKVYTVDIPANGRFPLDAPGRWYKILSASGPFDLERGDRGVKFESMEIEQGEVNVDFNRLMFIDRSGRANRVRVIVGATPFLDAGRINTFANDAMQPRAGQMFIGSGFASGSTGPTTYAQLQLWNANATKFLEVFRLEWFTNGTANFYIAHDTVQIPGGTPCMNMLGGGAASGALVQNGAPAAFPAAFAAYAPTWLVASGNQRLELPEPLIVPPGAGLSMFMYTAPYYISGAFFFREK